MHLPYWQGLFRLHLLERRFSHALKPQLFIFYALHLLLKVQLLLQQLSLVSFLLLSLFEHSLAIFVTLFYWRSTGALDNSVFLFVFFGCVVLWIFVLVLRSLLCIAIARITLLLTFIRPFQLPRPSSTYTIPPHLLRQQSVFLSLGLANRAISDLPGLLLHDLLDFCIILDHDLLHLLSGNDDVLQNVHPHLPFLFRWSVQLKYSVYGLQEEFVAEMLWAFLGWVLIDYVAFCYVSERYFLGRFCRQAIIVLVFDKHHCFRQIKNEVPLPVFLEGKQLDFLNFLI